MILLDGIITKRTRRESSRAPTPRYVEHLEEMQFHQLHHREKNGDDHLVCATNSPAYGNWFRDVQRALFKARLKRKELCFQNHSILAYGETVFLFANETIRDVYFNFFEKKLLPAAIRRH